MLTFTTNFKARCSPTIPSLCNGWWFGVEIVLPVRCDVIQLERAMKWNFDVPAQTTPLACASRDRAAVVGPINDTGI
jgi:hypothetical protein